MVSAAGYGSQERLRGSVVAERLAQMRIDVAVPRAEDETSAQLERILSRAMLPMAGGTSALTCRTIVAPQDVQNVSRFERSSVVGDPLLIDQQRERNSRFSPKEPCIIGIAQADSS